MKVLVAGNMGYVGPVVVRQLRESFPEATLVGLDTGYFAHCLTACDMLPERLLDRQYFVDVRQVEPQLLEGFDAVVNLAAISNDPMGNTFEAPTYAINHQAAVMLAKYAKSAGVRSYIFASSCSVYGCADEGARTESSELNPLTSYAKSKVSTERDLTGLVDGTFTVTCLRFATACGMSDRLRLDLVLNDFVAGAITSKKVTVLSDGTPWRPLINVRDMARAIDWAVRRKPSHGGAHLVVNVGSNEWNCQVRDLAEAVATVIPGVEVSINKNAQIDKRSYRVNYDLFKQLAPDFQPLSDLKSTVEELKEGLMRAGFKDPNYRESTLIRLNVLKNLCCQGVLTESLEWETAQRRMMVV
jgi:nucleoside-diphosphate-sugar epimerase